MAIERASEGRHRQAHNYARPPSFVRRVLHTEAPTVKLSSPLTETFAV